MNLVIKFFSIVTVFMYYEYHDNPYPESATQISEVYRMADSSVIKIDYYDNATMKNFKRYSKFNDTIQVLAQELAFYPKNKLKTIFDYDEKGVKTPFEIALSKGGKVTQNKTSDSVNLCFSTLHSGFGKRTGKGSLKQTVYTVIGSETNFQYRFEMSSEDLLEIHEYDKFEYDESKGIKIHFIKNKVTSIDYYSAGDLVGPKFTFRKSRLFMFGYVDLASETLYVKSRDVASYLVSTSLYIVK